MGVLTMFRLRSRALWRRSRGACRHCDTIGGSPVDRRLNGWRSTDRRGGGRANLRSQNFGRPGRESASVLEGSATRLRRRPHRAWHRRSSGGPPMHRPPIRDRASMLAEPQAEDWSTRSDTEPQPGAYSPVTTRPTMNRVVWQFSLNRPLNPARMSSSNSETFMRPPLRHRRRWAPRRRGHSPLASSASPSR